MSDLLKMKKIRSFFNGKNLTSKLRGDSILEVVIATALLSTVLIATFSILDRAVRTNANVKNRIIALNIAREGIEAVRNIRDTNWLKYSGDRRGKWLCLDTTGDPNSCLNTTTGNTIDSGDTGTYYLVEFNDASGRYYLSLNEEGGGTISQSEIDISTGPDPHPFYRLFIDPSTNRYTYTDAGNGRTEFHRQIYIEKLNPYNGGSTPCFCDGVNSTCVSNEDRDGTNNCEEGHIKVVSKVQWKEEGRTRTSTLEAHLYDFFERDAY